MDISTHCKEIDSITAVARHLHDPAQVIKVMTAIVEVCKRAVDLAVSETLEKNQKELDL